MIFNITSIYDPYKRVAVIDEHNAALQGNPRAITQLAFDDRICLKQIFEAVKASPVEFTDEEKLIFAGQIVDLLENSYQDVFDSTPELLVGKPKLALVERDNPLFDALTTRLRKEQWSVVFAQEDRPTFSRMMESSVESSGIDDPLFSNSSILLRTQS